MILGKVNVPYNISDITIKGKYNITENSLYDFLLNLAKNKSLVLHNGKLAYAEDIRPNYRDGELYIPKFTCKEMTEDGVTVTYDNKIEKVLIHTFKDGYVNDKFYVIPNLIIPEAYEVDIKYLNLSRNLSDSDKMAKDLFYRYIAQSYGYNENDIDIFDYIKVQKQFIKDSQRKLLKKYNLDFYGEYLDMDYRDVRNWKLIELQKHFTDEELKINVPYGIKRLEFELELYTRLYNEVYWEGWTFGTLDRLLNDKIDYLKYKEKGIYLIFKKRWLKVREV